MHKVKWSEIFTPPRFQAEVHAALNMASDEAIEVGDGITGSSQTLMNSIKRMGHGDKFSVRCRRNKLYIVHKGALGAK